MRILRPICWIWGHKPDPDLFAIGGIRCERCGEVIRKE